MTIREELKTKIEGAKIDNFLEINDIDLSIDEINNILSELPYLTELNLSNNRLKELPNSVGNLKNLVKLNLSWFR